MFMVHTGEYCTEIFRFAQNDRFAILLNLIELRLNFGHFLPISARNDTFAKEIARKLADRYKDLTLA